MQRYLFAVCVGLSLLPAAYAQATPEQPEPKPPAAAPEKTPGAKAGDGLPGIQDILPDVGFWDGMKDVLAEVMWTAKMALIGIVVVLALAVLGKIFVFMHK